MRLRNLWRLIVLDLLSTPRRSLLLASGIALGVWVLTLTFGLGLGVRRAVTDKVVPELPVNLVNVLPQTVDLGLFKLRAEQFLGGASLNIETLDALRTIPGVVAAYPKLEVKVPMGARGGEELFGRVLYTDIFMDGIPTELLDARHGSEFSDRDAYIPVLVSSQLLEIYNHSVASIAGTPQLTEGSLRGFEFDIVVGRSIMMGRKGARSEGRERAKIVGTSPHAIRLGVTVPLSTARRLLEKYAVVKTETALAEAYSSVVLKVVSPAAVPEVVREVEALGLAVDDQAEQTSALITLVTLVVSGVGVLIMILAAMNIAHSFLAMLSERRREFGIMRSVGARQADIVLLVLMEAGLLGIVGGILGLVVALASAFAGNRLATFLPDFPFKPESFFLIPWWLAVCVFVAAVVTAWIGALWPAKRASELSIVSAIRDL